MQIPDNLTLKQTQRNEVFKSVESAHLNPNDFSWRENDSRGRPHAAVSFLVHNPSSSYFRFDFRDGGHFSEFSPGQDSRVEFQYPGNWALQLLNVQRWLLHLKGEIDAPDLWNSLSREIESGNLQQQLDHVNRPLSSNEIYALGTAL